MMTFIYCACALMLAVLCGVVWRRVAMRLRVRRVRRSIRRVVAATGDPEDAELLALADQLVAAIDRENPL